MTGRGGRPGASGWSSMENANFKYGSSDLQEKCKEKLATFALWMQNNPLAQVSLDGHQSDADDRNQALAANRVTAVRDELVRLGVSPEPDRDRRRRETGAGLSRDHGYVSGVESKGRDSRRQILRPLAPPSARLRARRDALTTESRTRNEEVASREWQVTVGAIIVVVLIVLVGRRVWTYTRPAAGNRVRDTLRLVKEPSQDAATTTKVKTALLLSKHVLAFDTAVAPLEVKSP